MSPHTIDYHPSFKLTVPSGPKGLKPGFKTLPKFYVFSSNKRYPWACLAFAYLYKLNSLSPFDPLFKRSKPYQKAMKGSVIKQIKYKLVLKLGFKPFGPLGVILTFWYILWWRTGSLQSLTLKKQTLDQGIFFYLIQITT